MFYRSVFMSKTNNDTKYSCCFWWRGVWDVTIGGVIFKNLSKKEYLFFHNNF